MWMLCGTQVAMIFTRYKDFHLKVKAKKCFFFQQHVVYLGYFLSPYSISANPEKVGKDQIMPLSKNAKEVCSLWSSFDLPCNYSHFFPKFHNLAHWLHDLIALASTKRKSKHRSQSKLTDVKINLDHLYGWRNTDHFDVLKWTLVTTPVLVIQTSAKSLFWRQTHQQKAWVLTCQK